MGKCTYVVNNNQIYRSLSNLVFLTDSDQIVYQIKQDNKLNFAATFDKFYLT